MSHFSVGATNSESVVVNSSYEITDSDGAILCNTLSGTIVLTLPTVTSGKRLYIKKTHQNNIISVVGGIIEDDSELRIINIGTSVTLVCDGVKWWVA